MLVLNEQLFCKLCSFAWKCLESHLYLHYTLPCDHQLIGDFYIVLELLGIKSPLRLETVIIILFFYLLLFVRFLKMRHLLKDSRNIFRRFSGLLFDRFRETLVQVKFNILHNISLSKFTSIMISHKPTNRQLIKRHANLLKARCYLFISENLTLNDAEVINFSWFDSERDLHHLYDKSSFYLHKQAGLY